MALLGDGPVEHAPGEASFSHRGVAALAADRHAHDGARFAIVVARFNQRVTDALFSAAVDVLLEAGAAPDAITAVQVPGAVEVPLVARELASTGSYAAVIALGCVIRGETAHFDYVCSSVTDGCLRVQLDTSVPIGFGVITAETADQAFERSGLGPAGAAGQHHNVGADAARAALETAGLLRTVRTA